MFNLNIQDVELGAGHHSLTDDLAAVGAMALDADHIVVVLVAAAPAGFGGLLAAAVLRALWQGVGPRGSQRRRRRPARGTDFQAVSPALLVCHESSTDDLLERRAAAGRA